MLPIGFTDEINTTEPTRSARLKWVIVVNSSLPSGLTVNAPWVLPPPRRTP